MACSIWREESYKQFGGIFSALSCSGSFLFPLMDACNRINHQGSTLGGKKWGEDTQVMKKMYMR